MALDATTATAGGAMSPPGGGTLQRLARRRSTVAFLMTLPLIAVIAGLVAKIDKDTVVHSVEDLASLETVVAALSAAGA